MSGELGDRQRDAARVAQLTQRLTAATEAVAALERLAGQETTAARAAAGGGTKAAYREGRAAGLREAAERLAVVLRVGGAV